LLFALVVPTFCVSADAATDFTAAGVRGLLNSLAAVDATRAEVCSFTVFLAVIYYLFQFAESKNGDPGLPISVRERSDKQLHLSWMRAPVLAYRLPPSETEPGVCVHKDASPLTVGHSQLLMKIEGVLICLHTANW
jgi:hypothetical protein